MRLIDADELLKNEAYFADRDFINSKYDDTLRDIVMRQPVIERKHGHWIVRTNFGNGCYEIRCSKCGETGFWQIQPPYCPYCGSKNDEVTE